MNILNGLTLSPSLGWVGGGILASVLVILAISIPIAHHRARGHTDAGTLSMVRRTAMVLVLALMVLTPSSVSQTTNRAVNATDVYIAVDVTGSMSVKDAAYGNHTGISRLEAARLAVADLTSAYPDASFAALRFGASGTLDLPLTPDDRAVGNWARGLRTEPTSQSTGSNLDAPLDQLVLSMKETREHHPDDRILLYLITDGEQTSNHSRRSFSALRAYLDDAFVLGTGSSEGGRIPVSPDSLGTDEENPPTEADQWVNDPQTGQPGISVMDEKNLKALADEMSGSYEHLGQGRTLDSGNTAKASKRYRVTTVTKTRQHVTPLVWPLTLVEAALLIWELADWIRTSRRLL